VVPPARGRREATASRLIAGGDQDNEPSTTNLSLFLAGLIRL
jgi:hypothetical protein